MIVTTCPGCGKSVSFNPLLAGFSVKCPECPTFVLVPKRAPRTESSIQEARPTPPAEPAMLSRPAETEKAIQQTSLSSPLPPMELNKLTDSDLPDSFNLRLKPSVWKKRLIGVSLSLFVWAGVFALAWQTEGDSIWRNLSIFGIVISTTGTLALAVDWKKNGRQPGEMLPTLACILFLWVTWSIWHLVGDYQIKGTVHVENASGKQLTLELDGRPWCTSSPSQSQQHVMRHGKYRLSIRSSADGELLQETTILVGRRMSHVLNALNAEVYYRGQVGYGVLGGGPTEPVKVQDGWIDVTNIDFLFSDPPEKILVEQDARLGPSLGTHRTYLTRRRPPDRVVKLRDKP